MRLLIATSNLGKVREFREMLGEDRYQWSDLADHPPVKPVEETGQTFLANAWPEGRLLRPPDCHLDPWPTTAGWKWTPWTASRA